LAKLSKLKVQEAEKLLFKAGFKMVKEILKNIND